MSRVDWGDITDVDGASVLSIFLTLSATIPLANVGFNGNGLVSKWGNDIPGGESCFRFRRVGANVAFSVGAGTFGGTNKFDVVTTNNPISLTDPAVYRMVVRWSGARNVNIVVNSVTQNLGVGPEDTGYFPTVLINSPKTLRIGQEEDLGVNQGVNGCYGEFALYLAAVPDAVVNAYMAGQSLDAFPTDGVIYAPLLTIADLTSHFGSHTATLVLGTTCTIPPPVTPPPLIPSLGVFTNCGQAFLPNPCRQGC